MSLESTVGKKGGSEIFDRDRRGNYCPCVDKHFTAPASSTQQWLSRLLTK